MNASNFKSNWKSDEEIAAEQQRAASSSLSTQPSTSVSLNNVSSTFSSTSTSQYSSSSSAVFRVNESKSVSSGLVTRPVTLPTAKELNDIFGIIGLVPG